MGIPESSDKEREREMAVSQSGLTQEPLEEVGGGLRPLLEPREARGRRMEVLGERE